MDSYFKGKGAPVDFFSVYKVDNCFRAFTVGYDMWLGGKKDCPSLYSSPELQ